MAVLRDRCTMEAKSDHAIGTHPLRIPNQVLNCSPSINHRRFTQYLLSFHRHMVRRWYVRDWNTHRTSSIFSPLDSNHKWTRWIAIITYYLAKLNQRLLQRYFGMRSQVWFVQCYTTHSLPMRDSKMRRKRWGKNTKLACPIAPKNLSETIKGLQASQKVHLLSPLHDQSTPKPMSGLTLHRIDHRLPLESRELDDDEVMHAFDFLQLVFVHLGSALVSWLGFGVHPNQRLIQREGHSSCRRIYPSLMVWNNAWDEV